MIEAAAKFYTSSRLFLWRKEQHKMSKKAIPAPVIAHAQASHLTRGKLHDLAQSLDIKNISNVHPPSS